VCLVSDLGSKANLAKRSQRGNMLIDRIALVRVYKYTLYSSAVGHYALCTCSTTPGSLCCCFAVITVSGGT